MGIIEAKDLVHEYIIRDEEGNVESIRTALDHMDLSVEAGQFIAVLGHNGSGKSTFAKHLNALLTPSEGTLIVDGMDVSDESLTYDIRQEAGMVFQNPDNQIIASVVQEDVGFGPENIGVPTEEIWERVEKSLKAVGMWQYREHSPNKLSGGQKQRVAIAGVMAMEPKCIILDEPTAMLDPNGRKEVLEAVHALNREKGVLDIYMGKTQPCENFYLFAVYSTMFPHMTAASIVRYTDIKEQLTRRSINITRLGAGAELFIKGLSKKVLLADNLSALYTSVTASGNRFFFRYLARHRSLYPGVIF